MRVWVAMALAACGGKSDAPPPDQPAPTKPSAPSQPVAAPEVPPASPPEFPEGTRSLELVRTVGVRIEAGDGAKRIGTIAIDTRVAWSRTQKAKGCKEPWV